MTSIFTNIKSKLPIRRVIGIGFGFAFLILLVGSIMSYNSTNKILSAANTLSGSTKLNGLLKDIVSGLSISETNELSFVLTGKDEYLEKCRANIAQVEHKLNELKIILVEGSHQNRRLHLLEPMVASRISLMEEVLEVRQNKGFRTASELLHTQRPKLLMGSISNIIGYMEKEEKGLLTNGTIEAMIFSERIKTIILLGNIITFVVLVSSLIVFFIDFSNRDFYEQELIKAKELAEQSVKVKEHFLANVSHEIRTPMNAISGLTKILLRCNPSSKEKEYLDAIKSSADILLVIINDILDLSKASAGKMVFESAEFNLSQLISSISELLHTKIEEKGLKFTTLIDHKIPDLLVGDAVRLNQIILNLIGNSIKFTEKGEIKFQVEVLEEKNGHVWLSFTITDTGIGISEEIIPHIFESFTQASPEITRKYGGTGLGLNIVKELVEQQGGEISLKSKVMEGTEFSFKMMFPIVQNLLANCPKPAVMEGNSKNRLNACRVLLVEDNLINQMVAQAVLNDFGCITDTAENGKAALKKIKDNDYDIILMDIQMPEMSGYEATQQIRTGFKEPTCSIPIIAMTANAGKSDEVRCLDCGMNDFISKPFDENVLFEKLKYWGETYAKKSAKPSLTGDEANLELIMKASNNYS